MKKYQVEFLDENGATSPIDIINVPEDYTAEDYIKDCNDNADPEWCEMLKHGKVNLIEVTHRVGGNEREVKL